MYLFSQCFENSHFCFQIKSSDYCSGISAKLKYLNSFEYIFNPMFFIVSLEESHFGYRENVLVPQQNSQTSNEIGVDKSFKLPCFILTYSKAILHFHYSFNVQPSIFYISVFWIVNCVAFPMKSWGTMSSQLNGLSMLPEMPL